MTGAVLSGILVGLSAWARSEFLAMVATLTMMAYLPVIIEVINNRILGNKYKLNIFNEDFFFFLLFYMVGATLTISDQFYGLAFYFFKFLITSCAFYMGHYFSLL